MSKGDFDPTLWGGGYLENFYLHWFFAQSVMISFGKISVGVVGVTGVGLVNCVGLFDGDWCIFVCLFLLVFWV